ncbi:hypothetical protein ACHAWF_001990 [Thalassiosira exigua]
MASNLLRRNVATAACAHRRLLAAAGPSLPSSAAATPSARTYISRAHPSVVPSAPVREAVESLLADMDERHLRREERWERNKENRVEQRCAYFAAKGGPDAPTPDEIKKDADENEYRRMDESLELALQLNLDPRKPGQALRGSLALPHGNGKTFGVAVFTDDPALAEEARKRGAAAAGGAALVESIKDGTTPVSSFQRTLAEPDVMRHLSAVARILGPRGLMPNPKLGTIVERDALLDALTRQMSGVSNYRTAQDGTIRLGIGRGSFGVEKLLDNIRETMNEIQGVKPESFGKGKKGQKKVAKGTKYYLKAHLSTTQGKGSVLVDMRTVDPTSAFFMSDPS